MVKYVKILKLNIIIYKGLTCFLYERAPQASRQLYPTVPTNAPSQQRHVIPQQYFVLCAIIDYT
jgi:hypothetical protein